MQPPSLTPVFKIHKPSKLCPSNYKFVRSEPSTNEINYTNMLFGHSYENLEILSLEAYLRAAIRPKKSPTRHIGILTRRSSLDTPVALSVPSSATLQIRGIWPLFNQTPTLTCLLDFRPRLYAPKNASSSSNDIINTLSSAV